MIRSLRHLSAVLRRPAPRRTIILPPLTPPTTATISLAIDPILAQACADAVRPSDWPRAGTVLVVVDAASRGTAQVQCELLQVVLEQLPASRVELGIPRWTGPSRRDWWQRVADNLGIAARQLGERGWDRVELQARVGANRSLDVAAEATDASMALLPVVVERVPAVATTAARVMHDHAIARASLRDRTPQADSVAAMSARYLVASRGTPGWVVADIDDPVAAELFGQALVSVAERRAGIEARSPWEDPVVQRLCELRLGVVLPGQITLRATIPESARTYVTRLAESIGCTMVVEVAGGTHG